MTARLQLLEGVPLSQADRESITEELHTYQRALELLEDFATETPWLDLPTQPERITDGGGSD